MSLRVSIFNRILVEQNKMQKETQIKSRDSFIPITSKVLFWHFIININLATAKVPWGLFKVKVIESTCVELPCVDVE